MSVSYSTDGGESYAGDQIFTLGTSAAEFTYHISATGEHSNVRIRFMLVPGTTNGSRVTIDDVAVFGIVSEPTLFVDPGTLLGFSYPEGDGPSSPQSFSLNGENLDNSDVIIEAPSNFEISETEEGAYGPAITFPAYDGTETDIWVRLTDDLDVDTYAGDISINGGGADGITVAVAGTVWPDYDYTEGFDNFPVTGGSYATDEGTGFSGVAGNTWYYVNARGDIKINDETVTLQNNASAKLYSSISGGITEFSFDYMQAFSTNVNLEVHINGSLAATVTTSGEQNIVKNSGNISVADVQGTFTIEFKQGTSPTGGQVAIDNFAWKQTEPPAIANPVFDTPAGTYFSNQTVFISNYGDYDPTVTVYYTLDGNDPDDESQIYDDGVGIELEDGNGPIALKARAIDGTDESGVTTAAYTFPENVASIAAFRAGDNGTLYRITGEVVVLHRHENRNRHFVRDATGSLTIWDDDDNITSEYSVADGVTGFVGVKAMKNSDALVVLEAASDPGDASDSGLNVDPVTKTIANITLDDTGNLVKIEDVSFGATGTFSTGQNYNISDDSEKATMVFRTDFFDADYIGDPIPETTGTLTVIVGGFGSSPQVTARNREDLDFDEPLADEPTNHVTGVTATANSATAITVTWTDAVPAADGYLIIGAIDECGGLDDPTDGEPQGDGTLVQNVAAGVEAFTFTGLDPNTTYCFKIFPYNGSGATINYKTDEDVPDASATTLEATIPSVVISQVYGGGGNSGALYKNDFIELFNNGLAPVDLTGWSVQYASATGSSWQVTNLESFTLQPGQYYLIEQAAGSGGTADLPTPDAIGTIPMAATNGKVALVSNTTALSGTCPEGPHIIDFVGFGSANCFEGTGATPVLANNIAALRLFGGCLDTDDNAYDFETVSPPIPRNSSTTQVVCPMFWVGEDTDWNDDINWTNAVPDATTDVVLLDGRPHYPFITSAANAKNLLMLEGSSFVDNGNLTLAGNLTMERTMPVGPSYRLISSPVSGMTIYESDWAPTGLADMDFYWFKEDVTESGGTYFPWINIRQSPGVVNPAFDATFVAGKGYLASYDAGGTKAFVGDFNTGDVSINITRTETTIDAIKGWNIIGNPYPSGYSWDGSNYAVLEDNYAYVLNSEGTYDSYATAFFAPNQGFFVRKAAAGTHPFTFMASRRINDGFFAKQGEHTDKLLLSLTNGELADQTTIQAHEGTSFNRDRWDALKLYSLDVDERPQLFTYTSDEVKVAINSIPHIDEEKPITVGARIPADGNYTLSVNEISGRFQSSPLYLLDIAKGEVHNLKESPEYSFQASKGDVPVLFELWFTQPTDVPELPTASLTRMYTYGQTLYMEFGKEATGRSLEVFDISGRRLMHQALGSGTVHTTQLNLQTGVYIVRVTSATETETKRIFVE